LSAGLANQTLVNSASSSSTASSPPNSLENQTSDPVLSPTLPEQEISATLNQDQIRELIKEDRELSEKNRALLESTQGIRAHINRDQLELGAVISVADVPLDLLNPQKRKLAEKILQSNPALRNQSVYVALAGNYKVENGKIKINSNTQVSVGNMRFSLSEISQRSGISQTQLERLLNEQLNTQLRALQR
jgi:AraC-like DNA-binding protein